MYLLEDDIVKTSELQKCSLNIAQFQSKPHQDFYFHRKWQVDSKICKEIQRSHTDNNPTIWKKNNVGGLALPDFKEYI